MLHSFVLGIASDDGFCSSKDVSRLTNVASVESRYKPSQNLYSSLILSIEGTLLYEAV